MYTYTLSEGLQGSGLGPLGALSTPLTNMIPGW